jgi:hypothetical protein
MLSEAFASVLRSGRAEFNAQFAEAKRSHPDLDGAAFAEFLSTEAERLVRAAGQVQPERVTEVAMASYEAGLELVAQKLAGPGARHPWIGEGWQRVLPAVAQLVAASPHRILGAVSNALHNLATTPGARPEEWLNALERLGPECKDLDALLRLGQVAAWKAGLAHFRSSAIAAADALPQPLALAAVGAPGSGDWPEIRTRLLADPWFDPAAPPADETRARRLRVTTQAGAFRGFGGLFQEPPRVAATGDHFLVRSSEECWLLTADLFGATFHRSSLAEFESAVSHTKLPAGLRVADSKVTWGSERFEIASLGKFTSAAANATTLALTSELTHVVVLLALS